jgi:hypothetical protein
MFKCSCVPLEESCVCLSVCGGGSCTHGFSWVLGLLHLQMTLPQENPLEQEPPRQATTTAVLITTASSTERVYSNYSTKYTHTHTLTQRSSQRSRHVISTSRSFFDFGFADANLCSNVPHLAPRLLPRMLETALFFINLAKHSHGIMNTLAT